MDTRSLNYYHEEHFPMFGHDDYLGMDDSEGNMGLSTGEDIWQWEVERENNGDIATIPISSDISMNYLSNSPPIKEDCQKMLTDWRNFIDDNVPESLDWNNVFDCVDTKPIINNNVNRSMGKKIDMSAQCYIVENQPVSIKTEPVDVEEESLEDPFPQMSLRELDIKTENVQLDYESDDVDIDTISEQDTPILQAGDVDSLLEQFEATEQKHIEYFEQNTITPSHNTDLNKSDTAKRKEILSSLPDELIKRIKASSHRRIVPVIEPIPNRKRSKKINAELPNIPQLISPVKTKIIPETPMCVQLDHDYCASEESPYPKHPKKDSGFESAEEEETRNILKNQPTVKDSSGRLMVSLLKANTIQNHVSVEEIKDKEKRKLNLEEYKKRRNDAVRSSENSNNNSPINSGCSSPTFIEDENSRLMKHQQKLKEMAAEVLKTPPRSKVIPIGNLNMALPNVNVISPPTHSLPENIEVKVLVSIGINTDEVAELKEIRPILKNAINKIDCNSLITSVIENIHIKKEKQVQQTVQTSFIEHGEDKTIVYLDKCRPPVSTRDVFVQVSMVLPEDEVIQKRRRSCIEHRKHYKRRNCTNSSSDSCSSPSSSSSRSRSRSPTTYTIYKRNKKLYTDEERFREVEERRIVYVGGMASNITKEDLRKRFQQFGPITNTSIHHREYGRDNYGFVTFVYAMDAYKAVEHGNDDPSLSRLELSFGGRRIFCGSNYSDLDNVRDYPGYGGSQKDDTFDNLLREAQAKLRKRKTCI